MRKLQNSLIGILAVMVCFAPSTGMSEDKKQTQWKQISKGLEYGVFKAPKKSYVGDSRIRVLRIDPKEYTFHLRNASSPKEGELMSVRQWAKKHNFVAAINASMYQKDRLTSISLMKSKSHTNNPSLSRHKTVLAFTPKKEDFTPAALIIDRECEKFKEKKSRYKSFVQSIRMVSCQGKNVWKPSKQSWSTAAIANDKNGNILFIHVRSPYSTHELINILLELPLNIRTAMYVEGGQQAQMYVKGDDREYILLGRYRSQFTGNSIANFGWPVPNVIGIKKR
jgi:exopolysaccharide biosynthesis protein